MKHLFRTLLAAAILLAATPCLHAEYAVLRNGQRLHVTGYERAGSVIRLHISGGSIEVPAEDVTAIEPEEVFAAIPNPPPPVPFGELIRAASQKHGVDEALLISVIAAESNFNPRAVSARQAQGLMQLLPATAARFAVSDPFDPEQNIDAGTRYLRELLERYHQDLALALAAYNAGPERVEQYRGVPPFPETRAYVHHVTQQLRQGGKQKPR